MSFKVVLCSATAWQYRLTIANIDPLQCGATDHWSNACPQPRNAGGGGGGNNAGGGNYGGNGGGGGGGATGDCFIVSEKHDDSQITHGIA